MDLGVKGRVAVITGGSEGIGRAAAERLSAEGARLALVARNQENLDRVAGEIAAATGGEVTGIAADVSDEVAVQAMVQQVTDRFERLDILINNAGTASVGRFEEMTNAKLEADLALKVMGAVYCTRAALPWLKLSRGVICNTTTPGGKTPAPGSQPTALSRAAGISLTKTWAGEFAGFGIRVNTVCVGFLKSRQHQTGWERLAKERPDYSLQDYYAGLAKMIPMGRVGEPGEAGDVIAFLCSEAASYITGTAINVDGGMSPVV